MLSRKWLKALPLSIHSGATERRLAGSDAEFNSKLYFEIKWGQNMKGFFEMEDDWSFDSAKIIIE